MNIHAFGNRVRIPALIVTAFIFCAVVYSMLPIIELGTPFLDARPETLIVWIGAQFCAGLATQLFAPMGAFVQETVKILFTLFAVAVAALGVIFVVDASRLPAASIPVAAFLFVVGIVLVGLFALLPAIGGAYAARWYIRSSI